MACTIYLCLASARSPLSQGHPSSRILLLVQYIQDPADTYSKANHVARIGQCLYKLLCTSSGNSNPNAYANTLMSLWKYYLLDSSTAKVQTHHHNSYKKTQTWSHRKFRCVGHLILTVSPVPPLIPVGPRSPCAPCDWNSPMQIHTARSGLVRTPGKTHTC